MKTLRYRIRVLTLVLVCALLAVAAWTAKSVWFPDPGATQAPSAESPSPGLPDSGESPVPSAESPSLAPPDPWAAPTPALSGGEALLPSGEKLPPTGSTSLPSEEIQTPEALFDTFGL